MSPTASAAPLRVVLVTGLSGAGKLSVLRVLEDLGYETVDNPPLTMLEEMVTRSERRLAIGVDARTGEFDADRVLDAVGRLRANPALRPELVYATADETVLLRRYTESRRRHPLAPQGRVIDGVLEERALTATLRDAADLLIDTTDLPVGAMRALVERHFGADNAASLLRMAVTLISFAYPLAFRVTRIWYSTRGFCEIPIMIPYCNRELGLIPRLLRISRLIRTFRVSSTRWPACWGCSCRGSSKRARNTSPSQSAAPGGVTARCTSSKGSPPAWRPGSLPATPKSLGGSTSLIASWRARSSLPCGRQVVLVRAGTARLNRRRVETRGRPRFRPRRPEVRR